MALPPQWKPVGSGLVSGQGIDSVCAVDANNVYVAGRFTNMGGVAVNNIAKWNGSSWSSLNFQPPANFDSFGSFNLGATTGSDVFFTYHVKVPSTGNTVVGLSRYNVSSTTWTDVAGATGVIGTNRNVICFLDVNTIFFGGENTGIKRYASGTWTDIKNGLMKPGFFPQVRAVARVDSNRVVVGGNFDTGGTGSNFNGLAVWNNATSQWSTFYGPLTSVYSISVVSPTVVFVGDFYGLYRVNDAQNGWVNTNAVPNAALNTTTFENLYAADSQNVFFTHENGNPASLSYRYVGKWNGTSLVSLGNGLNNFVTSMSGTSSRNVYFVGYSGLTTAYNLTGNLPISGIVRWG